MSADSPSFDIHPYRAALSGGKLWCGFGDPTSPPDLRAQLGAGDLNLAYAAGQMLAMHLEDVRHTLGEWVRPKLRWPERALRGVVVSDLVSFAAASWLREHAGMPDLFASVRTALVAARRGRRARVGGLKVDSVLEGLGCLAVGLSLEVRRCRPLRRMALALARQARRRLGWGAGPRAWSPILLRLVVPLPGQDACGGPPGQMEEIPVEALARRALDRLGGFRGYQALEDLEQEFLRATELRLRCGLAQAGPPAARPARCPAGARPPRPTREYCLLPRNLVRWDGDPVRVRPQLWRLLDYLIDRGGSVSQDDLEAAVWDREAVIAKTLANTVSDLNRALEAIGFPWSWHVRDGHVVRDV